MKFIDLFCGAGGSTEGLKQLGFEGVLGIDNWQVALDTHKKNHPEIEVWNRDILTLDPSELPKVDIVVASPPCQKFSKARGKQEIDSGPTLKTLEIIEYLQPKYWILENVDYWGQWMRSLGFHVIRRNSCWCGVPQNRKRSFVGKVPFELFIKTKKIPSYSFFNLLPSNWVFRDSQKGAQGTPWRSLNIPFWTIVTRDVFIFYDKKEGDVIREMNIMDKQLVQNFPEEYIFLGSQSNQLKQIGNAVPPALMKSFFEVLVK